MADRTLLIKASAAKRMANLFRGQTVSIPVEVNGRTVQVHSSDITRACDLAKQDNLVEFCQNLTAEEVVENAHRIANVQRHRFTKAERMAQQQAQFDE